MKSMKYDFHRDFYNLIETSAKLHSVIFLLGPRMCGKTVCLNQLHHSIADSVLTDFTAIPDRLEQIEVFRNILDAINADADKVFLLDGMTYVHDADLMLDQIAEADSESENRNTKIVFTGSQSVALSTWADRAFAGNAAKIYCDFLSYNEYLKYEGLAEHSLETYNRFLSGSAYLHNISSLESYLNGCMKATAISNENAYNYIYYNECDLIENNVGLLVAICNLAIRPFHSTNGKIETVLTDSLNIIRNVGIATLKQALLFLDMNRIITITPVSGNIDRTSGINHSIRSDRNDTDFRDDLFTKYSITLKHPMLYYLVLKGILADDMPDRLPDVLLRNIGTLFHTNGI